MEYLQLFKLVLATFILISGFSQITARNINDMTTPLTRLRSQIGHDAIEWFPENSRYPKGWRPKPQVSSLVA